MTGKHDRETSCRAGVEQWELDLAEKVAADFETEETKELEAELRRKLLDLKRDPPPGIKDWRKYLAKFLYNKAANWIRHERWRERKYPSFDADAAPDEAGETLSLRNLLPSNEETPERSLAFREVLKQMDPQLLELWLVLDEVEGNRGDASKRLRIHRNTVSLWIKKIKAILKSHGFFERRLCKSKGSSAYRSRGT